MCIFTANKMCATLENFWNLVYYYRNYRSKMCAGIDFTSGDTGILSKKAFKFNKTLLCVLILAAALLLAGCGGSDTSVRAKADETVETALFDFACSDVKVEDSHDGIEVPDGQKLVSFLISITNTSDEAYSIFKDDFQLQWGDGDNDFGVGFSATEDDFTMLPDSTELLPDSSIMGRIYVAVPQDTTTLTVAYQEILEDGSNGNAYFVDLTI